MAVGTPPPARPRWTTTTDRLPAPARGFLDFGSRAKRLAVCRREVELNRRLAPECISVADVYGPDGAVCDHLVVMRRMPADRRLTTLVRAGAAVDDQLRRLARLLVAFHARAARGPEISAEGSRDAIRRRWTSSFRQVDAFHGTCSTPHSPMRSSR